MIRTLFFFIFSKCFATPDIYLQPHSQFLLGVDGFEDVLILVHDAATISE